MDHKDTTCNIQREREREREREAGSLLLSGLVGNSLDRGLDGLLFKCECVSVCVCDCVCVCVCVCVSIWKCVHAEYEHVHKKV